MAVPAIRAIRKSFPDARISVVVDPIGCKLLEHCPYIDRLIVYQRENGRIALGESLRVLREARTERPTDAVLFKRFFRNGLLAWLSGAKVRAGFSTNGKAPFLNLTVPYDLATHIAHLNLKVAALIGASSTDDSLEVFISSQDREFAETWCASNNLQHRRFVCAHYGGVSVGSKFMPVETFAEFLQSRRSDLPVVLLGNGTRECEDAKRIQSLLSDIRIATNIPLRQTIALMLNAAAFAGFNSGPAHLAAACKLPGLVIFPEDVFLKDSVRWRPLFDGIQVLSAGRAMSESQWNTWIAEAPPLNLRNPA